MAVSNPTLTKQAEYQLVLFAYLNFFNCLNIVDVSEIEVPNIKTRDVLATKKPYALSRKNQLIIGTSASLSCGSQYALGYQMLQVLRRLFALFSANLRRIAEKRIGKGIMQELLMHSVKPPKMQYKITVEYLVLRINKFSLKAKYFLP